MLLAGVPKRKTTRQLKELLQKQTARHMLPVLQEESFGKVRLEPRFLFVMRVNAGRNFGSGSAGCIL